MMKKKLESFTSKTLKAIAKEIKLKGYSSLNTDELREALHAELKKAENKGFDLSKYEVIAEAPTVDKTEESSSEASTEETSVDPAQKKVPTVARRTVNPRLYGRR